MPKMRDCSVCGTEFLSRKLAATCSPDCKREARRRDAEMRRKAGQITWVCPGCGETRSRGKHARLPVTGLCKSCVARRRGEAHPLWRGGEYFNSDLGRWFVVKDGVRMLRYRAVMEEHLGRRLRSDEIVHHINEDPTDDRIENLMITDKFEHRRFHGALTSQSRRLAYEMRNAGFSRAEVAAHIGCTANTVGRIVARVKRDMAA